VLSKEERAKAVQATLHGEKLPDPLRGKVAAYLSLDPARVPPNLFGFGPNAGKKRGRKRSPSRFQSRNSTIYNVINQIKKQHGLSATRNQATETNSAASIVCKALNELGVGISETQINRIRDDLDHLYRELKRIGVLRPHN
jgi:hypothetical protein